MEYSKGIGLYEKVDAILDDLDKDLIAEVKELVDYKNDNIWNLLFYNIKNFKSSLKIFKIKNILAIIEFETYKI